MRPPSAIARQPDHGERLGGRDRAEGAAGAEQHGGTEIREQQHRALALVAERAGVQHAGARGGVLVDVADVVAVDPDPDVVDLRAAPAPSRDDAAGRAASRLVAEGALRPVRCRSPISACASRSTPGTATASIRPSASHRPDGVEQGADEVARVASVRGSRARSAPVRCASVSAARSATSSGMT